MDMPRSREAMVDRAPPPEGAAAVAAPRASFATSATRSTSSAVPGAAVALEGDTALVGVPEGDIGTNSSQGAVYVYTRSNGVWSERQKIVAGDGKEYEYFGNSVAIFGDTVLIGAYDADVGSSIDQGAAYVFTRSGAVWTQEQKLTASDGAVLDAFGSSVALGQDTALVGAYRDEVLGNYEQGSAYVFTRSNGIWTEQQHLEASDGAEGDNFGNAVALSGDVALVDRKSVV